MTQTIDIDTMEAGREMDALVAERVMGLTLRREEEDESPTHPYVYRWQRPDGSRICTHTSFGFGWCGSRDEANKCLPSYSTDIAAAWQVVEHFSKGKDMPVFVGMVGDSAEAKIYDTEGNPLMEPVHADTPALAICRAALKAVSE
jgi:hypothetical protein